MRITVVVPIYQEGKNIVPAASMALSLRSLHSDKLIKSSSLLFVAAMVTNVSNYAFQIVMGRMLSPKEYGLMNALLAVFAFTPLTQADMVLVNRYFPAQDAAGIYASAAVLGKAVMYIPGAIILALFPMVSEQYALFLFHDSLMHIVFIMLTSGTLLLVTGIAIQYIPVLQPNLMPSSKV
jgi:O-antigen/teichoic acid export membrane protein